MQSLQDCVYRVLSIGWRGLEPHFAKLLKPLVKHDARIVVCSGGTRGAIEAQQTMDNLRSHVNVPPDAWRIYGDGFSSLVMRSDALEWVLGD
jgi:hypothetical protein